MYSSPSGAESLGDNRRTVARRVDFCTSPPRRNDLTTWYPDHNSCIRCVNLVSYPIYECCCSICVGRGLTKSIAVCGKLCRNLHTSSEGERELQI